MKRVVLSIILTLLSIILLSINVSSFVQEPTGYAHFATDLGADFEEVNYNDNIFHISSISYPAGPNFISLSIDYSRFGESSIADSNLIFYDGFAFEYRCFSVGNVREEVDSNEKTISFESDITCASADKPEKLDGIIHGSIVIDSNCSSNCEVLEGFVDVSFIAERWWEIKNWKDTIDAAISDVWSAITDLTSNLQQNDEAIQDHETRITNLENQVPQNNSNITIPNYFKFLGSSDRKAIVCGVATENHLDYLIMQDLGYECTVTYRQTSRGERASCRCSRL